MDREGNVVDVLGLVGAQGANGQPGADGTTPHIGENGNWFIGDTDTGVPARGEGGGSGSGILAETDPTVFVWAKSHLPFTVAQLSTMANGAGFVVNPTNFADGKTYFRYHAGATNFTWKNPNPQRGAVTITVLAWSQYGDKTAANAFSALNIVYGDGTTGRLSLINGQTVTMTTDANKVLSEIRGNYDHENWVLLDMDVLTIAADYPAPTGTVKSVNDNLPDENGNVRIPIPGGASVMVGATYDTDGASGLVPAPMAGDQGKFLAGDGTWKTPASSGGGTDLSLGVSGAAVGQTVRITAVDESGKPTAWEAVDENTTPKLLGEVEFTEDVTNPEIALEKRAKKWVLMYIHNKSEESMIENYPRINGNIVDMYISVIGGGKKQWVMVELLGGGYTKWTWSSSAGGVWDGTTQSVYAKAALYQKVNYDTYGIESIGRNGSFVAGSKIMVWGE